MRQTLLSEEDEEVRVGTALPSCEELCKEVIETASWQSGFSDTEMFDLMKEP